MCYLKNTTKGRQMCISWYVRTWSCFPCPSNVYFNVGDLLTIHVFKIYEREREIFIFFNIQGLVKVFCNYEYKKLKITIIK